MADEARLVFGHVAGLGRPKKLPDLSLSTGLSADLVTRSLIRVPGQIPAHKPHFLWD